VDLDAIAWTADDRGGAAHRAAAHPKVIKRYGNRKLYDTSLSRYVTLDDIAAMIRTGVEVRIVDNETMRDLTSVTLEHVISAEAKRRSELSARALRDLVQQGGARSHASNGRPEEPGASLPTTGHRVDALLSQAHREAHNVRQMLTSAEASLCRVQPGVEERVDRACDVVAGFGKLKRELVRFSRHVDQLHERLRELELAAPAPSPLRPPRRTGDDAPLSVQDPAAVEP
jgi:polyhydroxyalkanoate synthesis repressor PhaR